MKALSIRPDYALEIVAGYKTVECRTWKTNYRGDILICATQKKIKHTIPGHAIALVTVADVVPFKRKHLKAAEMEPSEFEDGMYAWILENPRVIEPVPVKGKLGLFNLDIEPHIILSDDMDISDAEADAICDRYLVPLIV